MDIQSVPANTSRPARPLSGNASYVGDSGILESPLSKPASILWASRRDSSPMLQANDEVISRSVGIDVWLSQEDVLGLTAGLLVVATAAQTTLHFSVPCPVTEFSRDPACRSLYQTSARITVGKYVAGCCLLGAVLLWRCWRIMSIQTRYPWLNRLAEALRMPHKVPSNHWVVSATEGLSRETFASQRVAHHLALAMQAITITLMGLSIFEGLMFLARDSPSSPSCQDGIHTISCQLVAWRSLAALPPWILFYAQFSIVMVTPEIAWAPASIDAARKLGYITFLRILAMPLVVVSMALLLLINFSLTIAVFRRDDVDSWDQQLPARKFHFISCLILTVGGTGMLLWSGILRQPIRSFLSACQKRLTPGNYVNKVPGSSSQNNDQLAEHQRTTVLLLILIFMCCMDESPEFVAVCITTGLRIMLVILVFRSGEKTSTFDDLTVDNAALGLVVNAKDLAAALRSMMAGKPWTGRLRTYRGTVLRMQRTLAVSYKWQEEDRDLTPEATLNMSDFQALEVVKAIRRSRCSYVWVDKLSVAQEPGPLQSTLLSRMLPVYASARLTLVIRTVETTESSQYHKRAWTLQEFCSAPKLLVVNQDAQPGSMAYAVAPDENAYFFSLRSKVQAKLSHCKPMWLYGVNNSFLKRPSVARNIVDEYRALAGMTHCQHAADKLRAFCPLLCNVTVEGHQELLKLIETVKMGYDPDQRAGAEVGIDLSKPTQKLEGEVELFNQLTCASGHLRRATNDDAALPALTSTLLANTVDPYTTSTGRVPAWEQAFSLSHSMRHENDPSCSMYIDPDLLTADSSVQLPSPIFYLSYAMRHVTDSSSFSADGLDTHPLLTAEQANDPAVAKVDEDRTKC